MNRNSILANLALIAHGGQANIYAYETDKVLRVPTRHQDFDRIVYEYKVYQYLSSTDIPVPKAYDLVKIDKAPAIIMERVDGISMMDQMKKDLLKARSLVMNLAHLHAQILRIKASSPIYSAKEKASFCIRESQLLTDSIRAKLIYILSTLPDGNSLCHGDFHPGNLLFRNGRYFIIDWSGASMGNFHSDVAHTYLLMKVVPKVPRSSIIMHSIQKIIGNLLANSYLKAVSSITPINQDVFTQWLLIKIAERTYYGLASEKPLLVKMIKHYFSSGILNASLAVRD